MKKGRLFIGGLTMVIVLTMPLVTRATDGPLAMIQSVTQSALAVLQNPALQGVSQREHRLSQVADDILPHLDTTGLARRALGPYGRQLSEDQQREFVRLFLTLVEHSYGTTIDRYGQDVNIAYTAEHIDGAYAEVDTQISTPSMEQPVPINYFVHEVNGQWLIYDVEIAEVSLDHKYHDQFARMLHAASYAELVQQLKSKVSELEGMPS
jgi:phospholipid transport system substrate-binding protein